MTKVKESLLKNGDTINGAFANNYIARFYENENKPDEALKYIYENLGPLFQKNHPNTSTSIRTQPIDC